MSKINYSKLGTGLKTYTNSSIYDGKCLYDVIRSTNNDQRAMVFRDIMKKILNSTSSKTKTEFKNSVDWSSNDGILMLGPIERAIDTNFTEFYKNVFPDEESTTVIETPKDEFEDAGAVVGAEEILSRIVPTATREEEPSNESTTSTASSKITNKPMFTIGTISKTSDVDGIKREIESEFERLNSYTWTKKPFNTRSTKTGMNAFVVDNKIGCFTNDDKTFESDSLKEYRSKEIVDIKSIVFSEPAFDWTNGTIKCKITVTYSNGITPTPKKVCQIGGAKFKPEEEGEKVITELCHRYREILKNGNSSNSSDYEGIYKMSSLEIDYDSQSILAPIVNVLPENMEYLTLAHMKRVIYSMFVEPLSSITNKKRLVELMLSTSHLIVRCKSIFDRRRELWDMVNIDNVSDEMKEFITEPWFNVLMNNVPAQSTAMTKLRDTIVKHFDELGESLHSISWLFGPFCCYFSVDEKCTVSDIVSIIDEFTIDDWFARVDEGDLKFDDRRCGEYYITHYK